MRATLFPSERLSDADYWRSNTRLLAWIRSAYLRTLPESQAVLPSARAERAHRLKHLDSVGPPRMAEARKLYNLSHPTGALRRLALPRAIERSTGQAKGAIESDRCTAALSFGDLLDLSGGLVRNRGAFAAACEESGTYELVTVELVTALAVHVERCATERASELAAAESSGGGREWSNADVLAAEAAADASFTAADAAGLLQAELSTTLSVDGGSSSSNNYTQSSEEAEEEEVMPLPAVLRVLEVGAGNGELAHGLRQALHARGVECSFVACDDGSWPLPRTESGRAFGHIERMGHAAALASFRPHVVIVSWMPMGVDWTAAFRRCDSLQQYILLGEAFDGAAGHNWYTWGNPAFAPAEARGEEARGQELEPPYAADGWVAEELCEVSRWMLSRFASDAADCECNSSAIAFRRSQMYNPSK